MRICVFCGAGAGTRPAYAAAAFATGEVLAKAGIGLVYGGASAGLMGAVADGALAAGGEVIGVLPRTPVERERAHPGLSTLHVVASMHERKALMAELSDAFIALPGGLGTLEELFEIWTWAQLGAHHKPCAMLNVEAYYDGLLGFLDHAVGEGFIKPRYRDRLLIGDEPQALLAAIRAYVPPVDGGKWRRDAGA